MVEPFAKGFLLNPFNGSLYCRGANVSSEYRIEPKKSATAKEIDPTQLILMLDRKEKLEKFFQLVSQHIKNLKGGALKAYYVICQETLLKNRTAATVSNERFMEAGDHLTRRDYVGKACDQLVSLGLITKKEVGSFVFSYGLILEDS